VNGGSIRLYACKQGRYPVRKSVEERRRKEREYFDSFYSRGLDPFEEFARKVERLRDTLMSFLLKEQASGKVIYALGASTKGNTLLQYYGITDSLVLKAAEVNEDKFGRRTVGSNIPIISEARAINEAPDYFLVLPWHFKDGLVKKVREAGFKGKFIFPLPEVEVV